MSLLKHFAFILVALTVLAACGGGGGGGDDESDIEDPGDLAGEGPIGAASDEGGLQTRCGVIANGTLVSPVGTERGVEVQLVSTVDSNSVLVTDGTQQILVKLQGLGGTPGFANTAAAALFQGLSGERLYFFRAGACTGTVTGDLLATVGSVVTASGISFAEEVIEFKYAGVIESSGSCGEELLTACYSAIATTSEHHVYGPAESCEPMPAHVRYRPSDADCGGNASVVVDNRVFGDVFSMQLRYPDGTDRIIQSCSTNECTPLKVQNYIRTGTLTVGCFGTPGNAVALDDINHTTIKRFSSDSEPPAYCIPDPKVAIN